MRGRTFAAALACAALAMPAAALGKGASAAKLDGPGIGGDGIQLRALERLAEGTGLYPAVFGQQPDPMQRSRPKVDLGPRYTISYVLPGPDGNDHVVEQDVYPYAEGGPVTFTAPGQPVFEGQRTRGGWFPAYADVKSLLVDAGLPATRPTGSPGSALDVSWPTTGVAALLVALLGAAVVVAVRRRPGSLATR